MLSNFFDLINQSAQGVLEWLNRITNNRLNLPIETIQWILDLFALLAILGLIAGAIWFSGRIWNSVCTYINKNKSWRRKYFANHIGPEFASHKSYRIDKGYYIETRIQDETPSKFEDPFTATINSITENFINRFINDILKESNTEERLYCILAGSGMGKTTALVNLFISYIYHYNERDLPYEIRILSLANSDVINAIKAIRTKPRTILLLDALDENIDAVSNLDAFMNKLEIACKEFRFVIISCRTQFFPDEESQLKESRLIKDGERKGYAQYNTFYISPFNTTEINKYITKVFPLLKFKKRRKAISIINNKSCSHLLVRPMVLSHIKQLVEDAREYKYAVDVYDAIVDYWLDREVGREHIDERQSRKEILRQLSEDLAVDIYKNKDTRKGYYIKKDDFDNFLIKHNTDNSTIHFRERSLINRDAHGLIKFSHKSFLEYFLAYNFVNGEVYANDFNGIEVAQTIYYEICKKRLTASKAVKDSDFIIEDNENGNKIIIKKIKDVDVRWIDYLSPIFLTTYTTLIKDLTNNDFAWHKHIKVCELYIKGSNTEYLKLITKFSNLQFIHVHGDICMRREKYIDTLLRIFPKATIIIGNTVFSAYGQQLRVPANSPLAKQILVLKHPQNFIPPLLYRNKNAK